MMGRDKRETESKLSSCPTGIVYPMSAFYLVILLYVLDMVTFAVMFLILIN